MALAQTAILFLPFVDILSLPIVLNLGLVLAVLIIREGYIHKTDRTECEAITSFMTLALIIFFNAALGWTSPSLMVAGDGIIQRAAKLAVPIALCRYLLGKDPGPGHPHKDLLRLANRTWFFNGVWMAGGEDSSGVPQVWRLRSDGSGTSQKGFPGGPGRFSDGTRIQASSEVADGFHEQFRWNDAERGTPRPGEL